MESDTLSLVTFEETFGEDDKVYETIAESQDEPIIEKASSSSSEISIFDLNIELYPEEDIPEFESEMDKGRNVQPFVNLDHVPENYKTHSPEEEKTLDNIYSFKRELRNMYPDTFFLLSAFNECAIEKPISTYVSLALLPYPDLITWEGCANFVADYFLFYKLKPPTKLPRIIPSPTYSIENRRGTCISFSIVLCSLLIGSGYDAYVLQGIATKTVTERNLQQLEYEIDDQEMEEPYLALEQKDDDDNPFAKYVPQPKKVLASEFQDRVDEKKRLEEEEENDGETDVQEKVHVDKTPVDPFLGQRIHFWVLIKEGKRSMDRDIFVETTTGIEGDESQYLRIDAAFNDSNYWVNLQKGFEPLSYNFFDELNWKRLLETQILKEMSSSDTSSEEEEDEPVEEDANYTTGKIGEGDKPQKSIAKATTENGEENEEENEGDATGDESPSEDEAIIPKEEEDFFTTTTDMPPSWVKHYYVSAADYRIRYPGGKKTWFYRKVIIERFVPNLLRDGMVLKITSCKDKHYNKLTYIREYFKRRKDRLYKRLRDLVNSNTIEKFYPGRFDCLKEYRYTYNDLNAPINLDFYHNERYDGLKRLIIIPPIDLREEYKNREDCLITRITLFGMTKVPVGADDMRQIVEKIEEHYSQEPGKDADDCVHIRVFNIEDNTIYLKFHNGPHKITASYLELQKPAPEYEKQNGFILTNDMAMGYKADSRSAPYPRLYIYRTLQKLLIEEEEIVRKIYEMEDDYNKILEIREREEESYELEENIYELYRNPKSRDFRHKQDQENKLLEQEAMEQQDFLAPLLIRIGSPTELTLDEAIYLKSETLKEYKDRLDMNAENLHKKFKMKSEEFKKKNQWHKQFSITLSLEEEERFQTGLKETIQTLHVLSLRIQRHREASSWNIMRLKQNLDKDPRLEIITGTEQDIDLDTSEMKFMSFSHFA